VNQNQRARIPCLTATLLLAVAGCGSDMEKLTDSELQDRAYQCGQTKEQTPGGAISCENYRRECQRRRDEGRYVC
jgi:hypothetical protein